MCKFHKTFTNIPVGSLSAFRDARLLNFQCAMNNLVSVQMTIGNSLTSVICAVVCVMDSDVVVVGRYDFDRLSYVQLVFLQ